MSVWKKSSCSKGIARSPVHAPVPVGRGGTGGQSRDLTIPGEQAREHIRLPGPCLSALLLILLSFTACGTLEVGIVATSPSGDVATATAITRATQGAALATPEAGATPTPAPTPTPIPASNELRVAFVNVTENGYNIWLWTEGSGEAVPLTNAGGVGDVKISDDGELVAFTRGGGLWMVRGDGTEERQLVNADELAGLEPWEPSEPSEQPVLLHHFDWIPGTHLLAFNTRLQMEIGLAPNDDLYLVNADTLERTALLLPGEGGEFTISPDGRRFAIVTRGSISLVNVDGSDRREVFTYTPVATRGEVAYYARPFWVANGGALRVVIPPADPFVQPYPPTSIWDVPTDGTPARLIGSVPIAPLSEPAFSPDLNYVAHLYLEGPEPELPAMSLRITDLKFDRTGTYYPAAGAGKAITLGSGETVTYPMAGQVYGWSPDPRYFAFLAYPAPGLTQAQIGRLGGDAIPACGDADTVIDVRWVDGGRYLCLAQDAVRGWVIFLGEVGGPMTVVDQVPGVNHPPAYDFAAPVVSAPLPTAVPPTPLPTPSESSDSHFLSGLIYRTADGLWRVDAEGRSLRLFEFPEDSGYVWPAVSPDGTQVLYTEANDLWLADLPSGERRNLTQTPDRVECCAQWWPGQPDLILSSSWTQESGGPNFGFPTVIRLGGEDEASRSDLPYPGEYQVLDGSQVSYALSASSPDGQTVAYDRAGQGWLYRPDTGPEPFDLTPYGLSSDPQLRVVSPAWSPDGRRLAWVVGDCRPGECQMRVGVFDLEAQAVQFLHPYAPAGIGGQPPAPVWSPDGRWLVCTAWAENLDDAGLWVLRADGQQEEAHHVALGLGRGAPTPVWSPYGRWLVFSGTARHGQVGHWAVEVGTWSRQPVDLAPDAVIVDWVTARP